MLYDELHQRYGSHIAKRVEDELEPAEFSDIRVDQLLEQLEARAAAAQGDYQRQLSIPFTDFSETGSMNGAQMDALYRRWREAEDLAYLISVAEDVGINNKKRA